MKVGIAGEGRTLARPVPCLSSILLMCLLLGLVYASSIPSCDTEGDEIARTRGVVYGSMGDDFYRLGAICRQQPRV